MFKNQMLRGNTISLIPLTEAHTPALLAAATDGELWELWFTSVPSADTVVAYVDRVLAERKQGLSLPYVVMDNSTEKIVGTTRYCNVDAKNRRLEIG
ncbi:MAG: GNAT family N-acetyltransferase, partial [Bacteroidota bacterium]